MQPTEQRNASAAVPSPAETARSAFREIHGPSLHGFALLLTLGDRAVATRLAVNALAAAEAELGSHRHPERAAAWLRARIVRSAGRRAGRGESDDREAALAELGVGATARAGLRALRTRERAAVIATDIERLDDLDVATIVDREGPRLGAFLSRARARYLNGAADAPADPSEARGPITQLVMASAARALS